MQLVSRDIRSLLERVCVAEESQDIQRKELLGQIAAIEQSFARKFDNINSQYHSLSRDLKIHHF